MEVRQGERLRWLREIDSSYTLEDRPCVSGDGPDTDIRMAFLGEAPGQDEEQQLRPFVGRAGQTLHGYLKQAGIYSSGCYFTNVIDRRPDNNNIKSKPAREAIEVQREALWEELTWLTKRGLKVVVALGNTAKDFFGIPDSITKCRGSIYEITINWRGLVTDPSAEPCDFVVVPTYHPSFIARGYGYQRKNDDTRSDLKLAWLEDFKTAHEIASKGYTRPVERFTTSPNLDAVVAYCQDRIKNRDLVAVDIETSGFNPTVDKVVVVGLAHTSEDGICVPFFRTGEDVPQATRYWTPSEEAHAKRWLERLFATCPLLLQNAVFDVGYLQQAGWQISPDNVAHDTMLLHHAIAAELPHNLGFITSVYGHTPYWKGEFLTRDTTIWEMNFQDLQVYNLRDCIVLHQVTTPMLEDLAEFGTQPAYDESLRLIGPIIEMQQTGALISRGRYNKWKKTLVENEQRLRAELIHIGDLPANFTFADAEVRLFLYGLRAKKHEDACAWEKHKPGSAVRASKKELFDMLQQIKPIWTHNYRGRLTDGGDPSLDKNGIVGLRIFASNRLQSLNNLKKATTTHHEEMHALKRFTAWLDKFAEWKRVSKMAVSFSDLPIRHDGRLHPSIMIHGTATGRLSTSIKRSKRDKGPSLQQWNKDEGADEGIREIIVAPKDHYIVAADYDSLEFRVMAYECGDANMLRIIERGLNQHDENTRAIFGIDRDHPKWATYRHAAKTYQFASQYGAGDRKLHETLTIRVPEANFTMADIKRMRSAFERTYPQWAEWCRTIQREVAKTRVSENAFGRRRILYGGDHEIRNQALNNPSQSGAAHIMNDALYRIWKRIHRENLRSRLQIQIHDEVRCEVPADELDYVCRLLREEMETPVQYRTQTVVFPASVSYGRDWHNLQECP